MSRISELRAAADRARDRARYCERQLEEFTCSADLTDATQERTRRKLKSDADRAEDDLRWMTSQLDRALAQDIEGVFA